MAKALWVTASPPDRSLGGAHIRQAHLLEALGRQVPTDLVVVGEVRDASVRTAVDRLTELPPIPRRTSLPRQLRRVRDLWRTARPMPLEVLDYAASRRAVAAALRSHGRYDVVHMDEHGLGPLLPREHANRWALTFHNVPSDVAAQAGAVAAGERQRWLLRREEAKARRFERWAVGAYDLTMTVSSDDASSLPGPAAVVPNGVDTAMFTPSTLPSEPRLLFSGTLGYLPNVDGLTWFCDEVLPRVQAVIPATTLEVVGRLVIPAVRELARRPGIELHVDVPSILPHLRRARVAVVPLRIGSGTRLKALEAMAAGRPMVGTTIGLAGLGIVDGRHARVADDAEGTAAAIVDLLQDDGRAQAQIVAARRLVEERFSWDTIGRDFVEVLLSSARDPGIPG
jgi:glycosyltransferase involved in cell wall biosynthesis